LNEAGSTSQVALNVNGKAQFSRSGRTSMSAGSKKKTITMAGVTTSSYIIATLQTNLAGVVGPVGRARGGLVRDLPEHVDAEQGGRRFHGHQLRPRG
jgi:hypothetical protein